VVESTEQTKAGMRVGTVRPWFVLARMAKPTQPDSLTHEFTYLVGWIEVGRPAFGFMTFAMAMRPSF
jgi:hypothetical protein